MITLSVSGESLLNTAKSYIGKVAYVFGADDIKNGKGDCSSFTQEVYRENGIEIGRDTNSQWQTGQEVSKDQLAPGDLVFFRNTYNSSHKDGVSHVGVYAGNGTFVHLGKKGVSESNLSDKYWTEHWLGARRPDGVDSAVISGSSSGTSENLEPDGIFETIMITVLIIITGGAGLTFMALAMGVNPKKFFNKKG